MRKLISAMVQGPNWIAALRGANAQMSDRGHLSLGVDWLLEAQRQAGNGGFAHSYSWVYGWLPAYPETTGYIIPTLLDTAEVLDRSDARDAAGQALDWLLSIQHPSGYFADLAGQPQVFDTGQILIGLNRVVSLPGGQRYADAQFRAAGWLAEVQAEDGSFVRYAYNARPHAYYSRVGAAMLQAGVANGWAEVADAGRRNLAWTCAQLQENGFFRHASFDEAPAYLHTMVYILEGLLDGYAIEAVPGWKVAVLASAHALLTALPAPDALPCSQYREDWQPVKASEFCLTGLAQWAAVCMRLAQMGHPEFVSQAEAAIGQLKRWQFHASNKTLRGGLPGSKPLSGRYMRFAIPNWGVKFFMDALLLRMSLSARG